MRAIRSFSLCVFLAAPLSAAVPAAAQDASPDTQPAQPGPTPGPLVIEQIRNLFVIAPDVRLTEVNGDFATLAGGYAGGLIDQHLLVGGGGYWLANRDDDFKMAYGGFVIGWFLKGQGAFDVGVSGLIGGGEATLGTTYGDYVDTSVEPIRFGRNSSSRVRFPTEDTRVLVREAFFIAEPQVTLSWRAAKWMAVTGGVGYRLIGGAHGLNDELRGVSGSFAVLFTPGS